jgi:hypothetical protein
MSGARRTPIRPIVRGRCVVHFQNEPIASRVVRIAPIQSFALELAPHNVCVQVDRVRPADLDANVHPPCAAGGFLATRSFMQFDSR